MKTKSFSIAMVACVLLVSVGSAKSGDIPDQPQSLDSRVLTAVDQHATDVRSLDRRFLDSMRSLEEDYSKGRMKLRDELVKLLNRELKAATQKGGLDQAIAVRDQIRRTEALEIIPPASEENHAPGRVTSRSSPLQGILGRWRWNNGVDITNLQGGRTSGNGTWRSVNPQSSTYEFRWKSIPADRVQLSANGRVLEGTKSDDPSFRVWAVRLD
ncbi:hypothetical protein CA13_64030 [Planctomycetes bacterium CA13]|uniref:Secreted protein n=1 Tax=Novipirellula herctigrandis TaxID=2527986 RepID=A0A5C5ZC77_9BACT|nr:hypothetical protein CA13_64030 [Planctomycetes bacterium CA13]